MDDSKKKGYIAGVVSWIASLIFLVLAFNTGWNTSGQVMGIFGLVFGLLGGGSFWKPESIGDITAQIIDNMSKNTDENDKKNHSSKVNQTFNNYGNMSNAVGSGNTLNTKSSKTIQKRDEDNLDKEEDDEVIGDCPNCDEEFELSNKEIRILEKEGEVKIKCPICHETVIIDEEDLE